MRTGSQILVRSDNLMTNKFRRNEHRQWFPVHHKIIKMQDEGGVIVPKSNLEFLEGRQINVENIMEY